MMKAELLGPVHPVDDFALRAFVEILAIIVRSEHIVDLNRQLLQAGSDSRYRRLSGYFSWSFEGYRFTLWQRGSYGSPHFFDKWVLRIYFTDIIDRTESASRLCLN